MEGGVGLSELKPLLHSKALEQQARTGTWEAVYLEAAHILEKGRSNDHLGHRSDVAESQLQNVGNIRLYRLIHSKKCFALDLIACLVLIGLTFVEHPADFPLNVRIHCGIEMGLLFVIGGLWIARYRWLSRKTFIREPRSAIKGVALVVLIVEAIVVVHRQKAHFRITRILRPIFLLDNYFIRSVRRYLRQVLRSVPPAMKIVVLLGLTILFFGILGFNLFYEYDRSNFGSLSTALWSLFYLSTVTEFPDLMTPSYLKNRWSAVYFVCYMSIALYFLINLVTAVVYASFTIQEKEKIKRLMLHRRKAAQLAHRTLTTRWPLTLCHFRELIKYLDSSKSYRDVNLMFCSLNTSGTGKMSSSEFCGIYDALALNWTMQEDRAATDKFAMFSRIASSRYFQWVLYGVIALDWILLVCIAATGTMQVSIATSLTISIPFLIVYTLDIAVKMIGLGSVQYLSSGWNRFDFIVTATTYIGLVLELIEPTDDSNLVFLITIRNVRILRLFKLSQSYKDLFGAVFILSQRLGCATAVFFIYYYCYAIVGMEVFGNAQLIDCCKNESVEGKFKSNSEEHFYLMNFHNLTSSLVTLFVLTVGSSWDDIMNGHAFAVSKWSRIYFLSFYFTTLLLLSTVVASTLDIFLCRISYSQKVGKEDERRELEMRVSLSRTELESIVQFEQTDKSMKGKWKRFCSRQYNLEELDDHVTFVGRRPRNTKHFLLTELYREEIEQWLKEPEEVSTNEVQDSDVE